MTEDREPTRLPPPVFPPGSRRHDAAGSTKAGEGAAGVETAPSVDGDDAFYYPEGRAAEDEGFSFISPDDPFPDEGFEEGTATGIGDDVHLSPEELATGGDPYLAELTTSVSKLAEGLRRRGEAGLHASPDMSRFEATLRAYCVGYLAGRRAEAGTQPEG